MGAPLPPRQRRNVALVAWILAQVLTAAAVLGSSRLIGSSYIDNESYILGAQNVLGIALIFLLLPLSLHLLWTASHVLAATDKELGDTLSKKLSIGMAVKSVLLAGIIAHFIIQPETLLDDAPDQLSMYIGGWAFAALLPMSLLYGFSAVIPHLRAGQAPQRYEQLRDAMKVLGATAVFLAVFFFSCIGIPIWNAWYTPKG
jgi:hypothetical protein